MGFTEAESREAAAVESSVETCTDLILARQVGKKVKKN
jgi:hypothetical protein